MGDGAADERVVPRLEPIVKHRRRQETASLPIPDELLAEILLLLPAADLARASAACVSFRRVAVDRSFRRLYRTRHPPPLLGFLAENEDGRNIFHPAVPPYPSAAADLSFSFLPAPAGDWVVQHVLDRRVLLDRRPEEHKSNRRELLFPETVVCDPVYRRYILLPPIPAHLAATVDRPLWSKQERYCETFLAPPDEEEDSAVFGTTFRVIWMAQCMTGLVAFVFSSNTGQWREVPPWRWSELSDGLPPSTAMAPFNSRRHVYGCFYWLTREREESELLVLDARAMEFSVVETPPEADICYDFAMVETGEGRPGMFVFVLGHGITILSYFIRQNDVGSYTQWQKVKTIALGYADRLICNMDKHLLLYKRQSSEAGCFTLDIETAQFEKVCTLGSPYYKMHAYINFPPSLLSPPTVSSGVKKGAEKEMLEQGCATSSSAQPPRSEYCSRECCSLGRGLR